MPEALPDLAIFVVLLGALIFCYMCVYVAKALLGTAASAVSWIPWVGSAASSALNKAEQHIVSVFSGAASGVQSAMGWSWHLQARMIDWLGREINSHANLLQLLAQQIPGIGFVSQIWNDILLAKQAVARLLHMVTHLHGSVVIPIGKDLGAFERWARTRVKAIDHTIDVTIPKDVAGLRARTKTIEGELSRLWKAVKANEKALATTAFVGAVALALSRLGLGWLRCNAATQLGKKYGCGLWGKLDRILGLIGDVFILTNVCEVIPILEEAFSVIATPAVEAISAAGLLACSGKDFWSNPLAPPAPHLPAKTSVTHYLS